MRMSERTCQFCGDITNQTAIPVHHSEASGLTGGSMEQLLACKRCELKIYMFLKDIFDNSDDGNIQIDWYDCSECGNVVAANEKVKCSNCGCGMTAVSSAGDITDDRGNTLEFEGQTVFKGDFKNE